MNQLQNNNYNNQEPRITAKDYFKSPAVQKKFKDVLGKRSPQFITTVLSIVNDDKLLQNATPESIMTAAMKAATLNLPIDKSLGFAYIVPFKSKAQFQLGYKGLIQLAIRSGQIKNINSGIVYESQFESYDPLFEELKADFTKPVPKGDKVAGYFATIRLVNGFEKLTYWPYEKVYNHGKRFSRSFSKGPWATDFDEMAQKTVLKSLIGTYAPLSTELEDAVISDNQTEDKNTPPKDVTQEESAPESLSDLLGTPNQAAPNEQGELSQNFDPQTGEIIQGGEQGELFANLSDLVGDVNNG